MGLRHGRRLRGARWALLAALGLAGPSTAAQARSIRPYVLRLTLCGWRVGATKFGALHDTQSGYYLIATGDCDGASMSLVLTPDPPEWTKPSRVTQAHLPRLRTGSGVNIGDTVSVVTAKLGARPDIISQDGEPGEVTYVYWRDARLRAPGRSFDSYTAEYTFRDGSLREIRYSMCDLYGCR